MGTMIQAQQLDEATFRGSQFAKHPKDLRQNCDALNITQPHIVQSIQRQYLEAGADIIKTNTFNSNAISTLDYGLENHVHALNLAGAHFVNQPFIPVSGLYAGQRCGGVGIRVTDRGAVRSMRIGLEIAALLHKKYPEHFDVGKILFLVGNDETIQQLEAGTTPEQIVASWAKSLAEFDAVRRRYFIYK